MRFWAKSIYGNGTGPGFYGFLLNIYSLKSFETKTIFLKGNPADEITLH